MSHIDRMHQQFYEVTRYSLLLLLFLCQVK